MANSLLRPFIRKVLEDAYALDSDRSLTVAEIRDGVGELRHMPRFGMPGAQSNGPLYPAIVTGMREGWIENTSHDPMSYRLIPDGSGPTVLPVTAPVSASTPAPTPTPSMAVAFYPRPNGSPYYPRKLGDYTDVEWLREAAAEGKFVLLDGPPGGGKTAWVEAAFPDESGKIGLVTLAGDSDTVVGDITGDYARMPSENAPDAEEEAADAWEDGPLVKAMTANDGEGCVLFVDDATLVPPGVLTVVYPAMDGRGRIWVKSRPRKLGREVIAGPKFYVVAAHNPGVPGAILSEALASRFAVHIRVGTDYDLAKKLGVDERAVSVAKKMELKRRNGHVAFSPQMRELGDFRDNHRKWGLEFAVQALIATALDEEDREQLREEVALHFVPTLGSRSFVPLELGESV